MGEGPKMMPKAFKGANVFMSRNLVPPEIFDALHDALKQNGAEVFLCCDPSRNGPNDYHVISSPDHEKFEDLRAKGCNLLGPQCILFCAKENRGLPKQGFTCCLGMDGVKILASGFEKDEKVKIEKLVTAMGGVLHTRAVLDISFVIVKNVLAAKYKWASSILKKPIVTINWLYQCWSEHRVVPQDPYRVPPFSGLTISATRIPPDERKEIEKLILQNGGKYSPDLTRNCTHLVADAPEGDKYMVARKWGCIHIVTKKWVVQSVARRACLDEESYTVQGTVSSSNTVRVGLKGKNIQEKGDRSFQPFPSSVIADTNLQSVKSSVTGDLNLEMSFSQNMSSSFSDATIFSKEESVKPCLQPDNERKFDGCIADDSQTEGDDLYLSDCRISFVGFQPDEMRKLVNMVRRGGGSRHMSLNEKLTHIIVGTPTENEKKEVRRLVALGVIYAVRTAWLEDCDRERKEVPVSQRHAAYDLILPKGTSGLKQGKNVSSMSTGGQVFGDVNFEAGKLEKGITLETELKHDSSLEVVKEAEQKSVIYAVKDEGKGQQKLQHDSTTLAAKNGRTSTIFQGRLFCFSNSFPKDRRAEIIEWINQGGGVIVDDQVKKKVHFSIECHGLMQRHDDSSESTIVSSHWIRSCLEDGCMLDVNGHILYSPLPCRVPLPGFESLRFCVSQYEEKERQLLRNLCFVLGAKFTEKLNKKVTHLICKFTSGPKYEAACKWGIQSVTSEWICECVRQDKVVPPDPFCPKEVTAQDREAGLCTMSQYPTQAACMISGDVSSQLPSQSQVMTKLSSYKFCDRSDDSSDKGKGSTFSCKRARFLGDNSAIDITSAKAHLDTPVGKMDSIGNSIPEDTGEASYALPDVAAAIEDLVAEASKIQDIKSQESTACDRSLFSPEGSILGQDHTDSRSAFDVSMNWSNRMERQDSFCTPGQDNIKKSTYDGFSETQTDSQVVGYEEDLSGRQMLIDRVRIRSSLT
ncbi:PREDICTED: DNA topoisomerase 2-binding protein 1-A isoform X2 [Nelumbo nucifera]|uniref:DNA topoisomerase 2-binding protein 1-A isoform X2 n=1 Tax=Nelumbo nucifera TaxID=4432 RepID=A0A1U8AZU1_NELNU|nr:PREDICTED: DNA topoisomerase 2-binding protein 1-A isoform X2 [Nelumbo nucifera]